MERFKKIDSLGLKLIAVIAMMLDHMCYTVIPGNMWMTWVGRIAFPIFAFLIVEGYFHTKNVKKYALRLLIFALISEVPFDMMMTASLFYPFKQNVYWTLLIGLLVIWAIDKPFNELVNAHNQMERSKKMVRLVIIGFAAIALGCLAALIGFTDYHYWGVLTILMFYLLRGKTYIQLIALALINNFIGGIEYVYTFFGMEQTFPVQLMAIFAMIPIAMYNGEKGYEGKGIQYAFYAFYPLHMLFLFLLMAF